MRKIMSSNGLYSFTLSTGKQVHGRFAMHIAEPDVGIFEPYADIETVFDHQGLPVDLSQPEENELRELCEQGEQ